MATDFGPAEFATAMPALDRGGCPLCGNDFDDRALFRQHLGAAHDLHDDQGTETRFIAPLLDPISPRRARTSQLPPTPMAEPAPLPPVRTPLPADAARRARPRPATRPRQRAVAALVLVVAVIGSGLVLAATSSPPDDGVAAGVGPAPSTAADETSAPAPESSGHLPDGPPKGRLAAPDGFDVPRDVTTAGGSASGGTAGGSTSPSSTASRATAPPSSTNPPAGFVAPRAIEARVDECVQRQGSVEVHYSWRFAGGNDWHPLATYTAQGGGRYEHELTTATRRGLVVTTVEVFDAGGRRHSIQLEPAVSSADC